MNSGINRNLTQLVILICLIVSVAVACQSSKDSGYIYFGENSTIWKLEVATQEANPLIRRKISEGMEISPNGEWLLYAVPKQIKRGSPRSIWIVNTRTGREIEVSHNLAFVEAWWLIDNRLAVIEYPEWHVSDDGKSVIKGNITTLIFEPNTERISIPSWTVDPPNNGTIIYSPTFDCVAESEFYKQDLDILRVTCKDMKETITIAKPVSLGEVAWSPDGNLLSFDAGDIANYTNSWRLYFWQRETQALQEINLNGRSAFALSWSPDSQWLAFDDNSNLCVIRLSNYDLTCYEDILSGVGMPVSWAFGSRKIVLSTCAPKVCSQVECDCSERALVTVDIPSGNITKLRNGVDDSPTPVWGP
ncbi:hypothetical protein GF380_06365 [Candidatus Uhrbacteria bacterium]|nr:hypothetical protein [Candidatus Uhrbacteria bacterium]